jgi:hypothetical protein
MILCISNGKDGIPASEIKKGRLWLKVEKQ